MRLQRAGLEPFGGLLLPGSFDTSQPKWLSIRFLTYLFVIHGPPVDEAACD